MSRPETAMILAAGLGTRMRPLTDDRPKPLLTVAGRAMIDVTLDLAVAAGVRRAVVNLHYLGDMIRAHLAGRCAPEILFSEEQPVILETGGGIALALPLLGPKPFYAINSDALWTGPNPLPALAAAWQPARMDALLLLVARERAQCHGGRGDFALAAEGAAPMRRGAAPSAPLVFTGAQIIAPGAFAGAPSGPFSLNLIWDRLIARGRLAAVTYPAAWIDVGTPEGLAAADAALRTTGA